MKKVCCVGLGYIGLPTALIAAEHGFEVSGFDVDAQRVARINAGDPVIFEPELAHKLALVQQNYNFKATTRIEPADYFLIAVPTPFLHEEGQKKADISFVWAAADSIASVLKKGDTVILESTVPVGTTHELARRLCYATGLLPEDFFVAHCPERVLPGKIFYELVHNARIIGGVSSAATDAAKYFYQRFVTGPLYLTNATTAEMVKLVENSSRDVAIAFANQVAAMAECAGLDPYEVIELANKHPRVNLLKPGCGVGGHCIAIDPWFLIQTFPGQTALLQQARAVNDEKPYQVAAAVQSKAASLGLPRPSKVLLLGATYKADIDDIRESPALVIAQALSNASDMELKVCDPYASTTVLQERGLASVLLEDGLAWADLVVCLVMHKLFVVKKPLIKSHEKVIDFCGLLHEERYSQSQEINFWPSKATHHQPSSDSF